MNTESEITELKQQVTRLRRELDELRQFIHYHPPDKDDDGNDAPAYLTIRCSILTVVNPSQPNETQIYLVGSRHGAFVSVMGKDEKTRVLLQVEKDVPEVSLFGKDGQYGATMRLEKGEPELDLYGRQGKLGVMLKVQGDDERGQVGVCEAGKPRAVMQARANGGGGVSLVHDDGHPRIALASEVDHGDLLMVTADMQVGVKISSNGQEGGFITVNRSNGKAGVIISNIATGGAIIVNDKRGRRIASLPSTD